MKFLNRVFNREHKTENIEPTPTVEYVDLGLPSGTLWAKTNYGSASPEQFGKECTVEELPEGLPTYEQAYELIEKCEFSPIMFVDFSKGWRVTGPNGNSLFFRVKLNNEAYLDTDSTTLWCQSGDTYTPIMVFSESNITIGMAIDKSISSQLRQVKKLV